MQKVAIIGGHGKIAQELTRQLTDRGDAVLSVFRNPAHAPDLEKLGAEPLVFDLENSSAADLARRLDGVDALVFAAGGGPDSGVERKKSVDRDGSILSAEAALQAGVNRFVQISAIGVDEPVDAEAGEVWSAYVHAKREADEKLRETSLDWTILRPGGLTDDAGTGSIELAEKVDRGSIPRQDVAATVLAALDTPDSRGHTWELVSGGTRIADAVDGAVAAR